MSNHLSGPELKPPGGDGRLDFTDLFAFQAPKDPSRCVLIMDVNPFAPSMGEGLHPDAVYRINIDNDGDLQSDVAFSVVFSPSDDSGRQSASVRLATGEQARDHHASGEVIVEGAELSSGPQPNVVKAGPYTFAAGLRSDPFFADIDGILNNFQWTGNDTIADKNVYSMALEFPSELLGPSSNLALWARVSVERGGSLTSVDRGGQPTVTAIFNPEDAKDEYNRGEPAEDRESYLERFAEVLERAGICWFPTQDIPVFEVRPVGRTPQAFPPSRPGQDAASLTFIQEPKGHRVATSTMINWMNTHNALTENPIQARPRPRSDPLDRATRRTAATAVNAAIKESRMPHQLITRHGTCPGGQLPGKDEYKTGGR